MRLLVALVVWAAAIAGGVAVSSVVAGSIHNKSSTASISTAIGSGGAGSGSGSGSGGGSTTTPLDASSVRPTDSLSLFGTSNFARALAILRSHLGAHARVDTFALYPGYISFGTVKNGNQTQIYLDAAGTYREINTGAGAPPTPRFSLSRVKADVPATLVRRIATAGHVPSSQLRYMVVELSPANNQFRWLVYPVQGNRVEYFQAPGATGPLLEYLTNSSTGLQLVR